MAQTTSIRVRDAKLNSCKAEQQYSPSRLILRIPFTENDLSDLTLKVGDAIFFELPGKLFRAEINAVSKKEEHLELEIMQEDIQVRQQESEEEWVDLQQELAAGFG